VEIFLETSPQVDASQQFSQNFLPCRLLAMASAPITDGETAINGALRALDGLALKESFSSDLFR
jgi:hypothetical protein